MKRYLLHLFIVCFYANALFADTLFDQKLKLANDLVKASLFDTAILNYQELESLAPKREELQKVHLLLAKAYFQNKNYEKVIEVINNKYDTSDFILLKAMAHNLLKEYSQASLTLSKLDFPLKPQAVFELGLAKFHLKDEAKAKALFQSLIDSIDVKNESLKILSKIYLIRLDLNKGLLIKAKGDLADLAKNMPVDHPLQTEISYLRGQIFFQLQDYKNSIIAFEKAAPKQHQSDAAWKEDVLYYLGWSFAKAENKSGFYPKLLKTEENPFHANSLYINGLNEFKAGKASLFSKNEKDAFICFEKAHKLFEQAAGYFKETDKKLMGLSLKFQASSLAEQNTASSLFKAFEILNSLIAEKTDILESLNDPLEIYYLRAFVFLKMQKNADEKHADEKNLDFQVFESLEKNLENYKHSKFVDLSLDLAGTFYYQNKKYEESAKVFLQLAKEFPSSDLAGGALYKASLSLEYKDENIEKIKALKKQVYTEYKDSEYAATSYFSNYSYQEYIEGDREALKHLQLFPELYKKSPLILNAYYLLGLDCKRDRKTIEGKWIRKKNLNLAIDNFQAVESYFDELYQDGRLDDDLNYFIQIRYLAMLERALTNLKIAEESQGAKEKIYLEYAKTVFLKIIEDFNDKEHCLLQFIVSHDPYPQLLEESSYWLGISHIKSKNTNEAKKVFLEMVEKYERASITKGYFLSRSLYELGLILQGEKDYGTSLSYFLKSEDAAKGRILNSEQKLDLWIQQSLCYQGLKQFDLSILTLSKVINDDAISGQRLKAMFLRAEMYELQGRLELSRKHFEATSKKGGEWALKAKSKLEKDYGY